MKRSGTADLPLHGGRVPPWLAARMTELGTAIAEQVILNYGQSEFPDPIERSILVPGLWSRDGNGLALLGYSNFSAGGAKTRDESAFLGAWINGLRRPWPPLCPDAG